MEGVIISDATDGSRMHPEETHEVFWCTRSCERVAHKARQNARKQKFTQGSIAQWLHLTDETIAFTVLFFVHEADDVSLRQLSSKMGREEELCFHDRR